MVAAAALGAVQEGTIGENDTVTFGRAFDESALFRICFVCTGNTCRSPMAEAVFREIAARRGLADSLALLSAGTGDWHVGEQADPRAVTALAARGYDGSAHRARQFDPDWFNSLDLVVAFDRSQERMLTSWARTELDRSKVHLLLRFDREQAALGDIPDPYYSDTAYFETVLTMIERASLALFQQLEPGIRRGVR